MIDDANDSIKRENIANYIDWYVQHFTPNVDQDAMLAKHIISGLSKELSYVERPVLTKSLNT